MVTTQYAIIQNTAKKSAGDLTKEKDLKVMLSKAVEDWNADVAVSEQPVKPKGKGLKAERKTNKPFVGKTLFAKCCINIWLRYTTK